MVEVGEKILVHCFSCKFSLIIFLVELQFRIVNLFDYVFELFESESFAASTVVGITEVACVLSPLIHQFFKTSCFCS